MSEGKRVRLCCDLTRYDARLVLGSLGYTTGRLGQYGMMITYDCGAYLDTLGQSLEYVDMKCPGPEDPEGYLRWKDAWRKKATKITVQLGPRGGLLYLRYKVGAVETVIDDKYSTGLELDALLALNKRITEIASDGTKTKPTSIDRGTPLQAAWKRQREAKQTVAS